MIKEKEIKQEPKLRFSEFEGEWGYTSIQKLIDKKAIVSHLDGNHGSLYPRSEEFAKEGIPYVTANDFVNGLIDLPKCKCLPLARAAEFKKGIAKDGDVLFAHNATVGPVALLRTNLDYVILSTTATYYRCDSKQLLNRYLLFNFQTIFFIRQYLRVMSQSTRNQVPITTQRLFSVYFPTLPEQQKIASFLSAVDQKIQQFTRKKELLEQYKRGVMQKIFSREIRFKDENGKDYPDWEEKRLGELINKMQSGISRKLSDLDIGLPILRSNNLVNGKLDISEIKYWYLKDDQGVDLGNYLLKDKDLLVNFINSIAQIGKVAMFENLLQRDTIFTTNLMRLSFKDSIDHYYVYYYFHLKVYVDYIQSITKPAVNQASFTTKDFQNFKLLLPDILEQQKIVSFLLDIDKKIESVQTQLTQTQQFKKGLLQQMFV